MWAGETANGRAMRLDGDNIEDINGGLRSKGTQTAKITEQGLKNIFRNELLPLVSMDDDSVSLPQSLSDIAAWRSGSELLRALDAALPQDQAQRVAMRALHAIHDALDVVLNEDGGIKPEQLPSPEGMYAAASLASNAALLLPLDSHIPILIIDSMIDAAEQFIALAMEVGAHTAPGRYTLQLALSVARNLKALFGRYACSSYLMVHDVIARIHVLLLASAHLATAEHQKLAPPPGVEEPSVLQAWGWDLDHALDSQEYLSEKPPGYSLARVWAESATSLLSAAWSSRVSDVRTVFIPLATASSEKECILLLLGRLLAVLNGAEEASRIIIPVLTDALAAKSGDLDAGVYAVAAHSLACIAASCAVHDNDWGYVQVVDLLTKLYKFPQFSISASLLHGSRAAPEEPRGTPSSSVSPWIPALRAEVRIAGRCPGALASALARLAKGLRKAPVRYRKDFRHRLLSLFSDFALILPNESYNYDLGALLPAVSSIMRSLPGAKRSPSALSASLSLSSADLSLDALNLLQEEGRALSTALRHLWLCSSVYDFATVASHQPRSWPKTWATALSSIAIDTPILLLGSEQQKSEAFYEDAAAEYGTWLSKLEGLGEAAGLTVRIASTVGYAPGTRPLPGPVAAHVLTVAYKAICHAVFQDPSLAAEGSPLGPVLVHMQYSLPTAVEYPWLKQTLKSVYATHTRRLMSFASNADDRIAGSATVAVDEAVEVLTASLVLQAPNDDVARTAAHLLHELTAEFPGVLFNYRALATAIQALSDAATVDAAALTPPTTLLPRTHLLRLVQDAASISPGLAEAVVLELMRHLAARGWRHPDIVVQFTPEVMKAVGLGRQSCTLPDMSKPYTGLIAWSSKLHALGVVSGLSLFSEHSGSLGGGVVAPSARLLMDAFRDRAPDKILISRLIQVAGAIIHEEDGESVQSVLQMLAWAPIARFTPEVLAAVTMAWHWLLAAGNERTRRKLLDDITAAWMASCNQRLGLFSIESGGSEDMVAAIRSHHAWVIFLLEVWRARQHDFFARKQLHTALLGLLEASVRGFDQDIFTLHRASAGARFRLLHLGLSVAFSAVQTGKCFPDDLVCARLYRRIILSGLAWFAAPVAWHDADPVTCRESAAAVRNFANLLEEMPALIGGVLNAENGAVAALREAIAAPYTSLLHLLLLIELERLVIWTEPLDHSNLTGDGAATTADWTSIIKAAWEVSPRLAIALGTRFPGIPTIAQQLQMLVLDGAADPVIQSLPEAVQYLVTSKTVARNAAELQHLSTWRTANVRQAMVLAAMPERRHPSVVDFLVRSLDSCSPEDVAFYLPQLVQLLRHDPDGKFKAFLIDMASHSAYFAYLLVCQLSSEGTPPPEAFSPAVRRSNWTPPVDTGLWSIADGVRAHLRGGLHGDVAERLDAQLRFFGQVTAVSGKLYPIPKDERKTVAMDLLRRIQLPRRDLFMPTDPSATIVGVKPETVAPMQSAAKCPILVAFDVEKQTGVQVSVAAVEAAIFKVGDDCRQDLLALQVIALLKTEFDNAQLPLHLVPYGVVPTGHECGIIEVVPHAKSRAQLGELTDGGLFEIFQREFGLPGSARFEAARSAFIASSAAYAVASYLLQAKDRHNGNIMIDNRGRIIHIDFGYILGISPGGNMGFESAAFKLSYEMTQLLDPGNTRASPHYTRFQELCVKGYLAARSSADCIMAAVANAEASRLPCFSRGGAVEGLRARFHLEMTDKQAAEFMRRLIADAYDKWTTGVYDLIQYYQNRIPK